MARGRPARAAQPAQAAASKSHERKSHDRQHLTACECRICALVQTVLRDFHKEGTGPEDEVVVYDPRGSAQWARSVSDGPTLVCVARAPPWPQGPLHPSLEGLTARFGPRLARVLAEFPGCLTETGFRALGGSRNGGAAGADVLPLRRDLAVRLHETLTVRVVLLRAASGRDLVEDREPRKVLDRAAILREREGVVAREAGLREALRRATDAGLRRDLDVEPLDDDLLWLQGDACVLARGGAALLFVGEATRCFDLFVRVAGEDLAFDEAAHGELLRQALPAARGLLGQLASVQAWHVLCLPDGTSAVGLSPRPLPE